MENTTEKITPKNVFKLMLAKKKALLAEREKTNQIYSNESIINKRLHPYQPS